VHLFDSKRLIASQRGMDSGRKEEDFVLTDTVKLLNVAVGAGNRMSQLIAKLFMKVQDFWLNVKAK